MYMHIEARDWKAADNLFRVSYRLPVPRFPYYWIISGSLDDRV